MKGAYEYKIAEENTICKACPFSGVCLGAEESCSAIRELLNIIEKETLKEKRAFVRSAKRKLELEYSEPSKAMEEMGKAIIKKFKHLEFIKDLEIKIGYVISTEEKVDKGMIVYGTTQKVKKELKAYLPFDYVITFYEPNVELLNPDNQKILMLHELQHIEMGEQSLKVREHDVQDFSNILHRFGIEWNGIDNQSHKQIDILDKAFKWEGGVLDE